MGGFDRDFESDSDDNEPVLIEESEIQFHDNPVLKDFLNLSNGGARLIQATSQKRRTGMQGSNG